MTNTLRETPASKRRKTYVIDRGRPEPLPFRGPAPDTYTAILDKNQGTNDLEALIQNPFFPSLGHALDVAVESHLGPGRGSTVSVIYGNLVGKPLYAVSIFPGRTVELNAPPTWQQLFAFALLNRDLLLRPEFGLGTWFDALRGLHVLDVVICIADRPPGGACTRPPFQTASYIRFAARSCDSSSVGGEGNGCVGRQQ
jgi:hypothetical protein